MKPQLSFVLFLLITLYNEIDCGEEGKANFCHLITIQKPLFKNIVRFFSCTCTLACLLEAVCICVSLSVCVSVFKCLVWSLCYNYSEANFQEYCS